MKKIETAINKNNKIIVDKSCIDKVVMVLKSGILSRPEGGKYVKEFQNKMFNLLNKKFCFTTTSGTSSLHAAIVLLRLKSGDEVLAPAITFMADASVVLQELARLVFVDILDKDFNMDPVDAVHRITPRTRAIIAVHMYGQPANIIEFVYRLK